MESRVYFDPLCGIVVVEAVGAVTAADLDIYGVARMYDLSAGDQPAKARAAFRDRGEAEGWLRE